MLQSGTRQFEICVNMSHNSITDFYFDLTLATCYHSQAQKIRVMSESWVGDNLYCPCCGNPRIEHQTNNKPVGDFKCESCGEEFELKSKSGRLGKSITDGAYLTMIERISSCSNPHLLILNYAKDLSVQNMLFVPKFFFVPAIIEKRKPLADTAQRAGWVGCNILIGDVPQQGKISLILSQQERNRREVIEDYKAAKGLHTSSLETRGWLLDVLNCVNAINDEYFELADMYDYVPQLKSKHQQNNNIEAKIRQQLQNLRDKGFVEFLGQGCYRKLR